MAVMLQGVTTLCFSQFHIVDDIKVKRFTNVTHKFYT
jgi:hypothetical protein